ncbi:hypothetical protein [Marinoscillum sp.]|uniref:hypothetical protein n=1 Tax=Marinoscillum sp. TaxID=2024838 RepID=UPI003BAD678A
MSTEKDKFNDILLQRLWNSYETVTNRRRKAFFALYYSIIVIAILVISPVDDGKIKFFTFEFESWILTVFSPAIILVLINNYLYLSSHTVVSYSNYLEEFTFQNKDQLSNREYSFTQLYNSFRLRDVTTNLNLFNFPAKESLAWDNGISKRLKLIATPLINLTILLTYLIPFSIYVFLLKWNFDLDLELITGNQKTAILSFYILLGLSFVVGPIYFFGRVKRHKKKIDGYFLEDNEKFRTKK